MLPSHKPILILDATIARANIQKMADKCRKEGLLFRPHFKTHQAAEIGEWFRDAGVKAITVSSIDMAFFFKKNGWKDILIAFPVNTGALPQIESLARGIRLTVLVNSVRAIHALAGIAEAIGVAIELDPDYGRSGVPIADVHKMEELKFACSAVQKMSFSGFYVHAGHTYKCSSVEEIRTLSGTIFEKLGEVKAAFPDSKICFGDTPSCSVLHSFPHVDVLSPGNFVFYDWMQASKGVCPPEDIAVEVRCPVIEVYPERNQILIHGGAVHFSKDYLEVEGEKCFGVVSAVESGGAIRKVIPGAILVSALSQEHGLAQTDAETLKGIKPGDFVRVYPVHSCLTADLMREYHLSDFETIRAFDKY